MKLLLDQGLPLSAAALLRDEGIDTIHVGEIGMSAAEDADIIQRARDEDLTVVTLDADFHTLLALDVAITPSVIRIRIERLRAQALTLLLLTVIAECQEDLVAGAAITVEPGRIRIRRLPLVPDI
jgi:predicted nuclease of predicted toxin-antitoxin system